jgi:hypothetical protein
MYSIITMPKNYINIFSLPENLTFSSDFHIFVIPDRWGFFMFDEMFKKKLPYPNIFWKFFIRLLIIEFPEILSRFLFEKIENYPLFTNKIVNPIPLNKYSPVSQLFSGI